MVYNVHGCTNAHYNLVNNDEIRKREKFARVLCMSTVICSKVYTVDCIIVSHTLGRLDTRAKAQEIFGPKLTFYQCHNFG
jgi:hypothetical protein